MRTPKPWHERAAIVSFDVSDDTRAIVADLRTKHIIVSARDGGVRASVGIYNNFDDIDVFIDSLPQ